MTIAWRAFLFLLLPFTLHAAAKDTFKVPDVANIDDLAKDLKLDSYKGQKFGRKIKFAILDNGFKGLDAEIGKSLPAACPAAGSCTQYHDEVKTVADTREHRSPHGTQMTKLAHQIIKRSGADASVEYHLYNTYGYDKLKAAVEDIAKGGFDVVLYAQVWEYGGNLDGKGFINALINKALASGVLWINAAGDFGRTTRVAPVKVKDGFVEFTKNGKTSDGVTLVCKQWSCELTATLTWNDFKDEIQVGTDKDLDLILLNSKGEIVPVGEHYAGTKRQALKPADTEEFSYYPREFIESEATGEKGPKPLNKGTYKLRVKAVSSNFDENRDSLRLTVVDGQGIEVQDADTDETLLIPADNPGVIAVGAYDTATSGKSKRLDQPQINLPSLIRLANGAMPYSTSNSAAMAAAVTVLNIGTGTEKTIATVTAKLKDLTKKPQANPVLDQQPAQPVVAARVPGAPPAVNPGGVPQLTPAPRGSAELEGFDPQCRRLDPRKYPLLNEVVAEGGVVWWYRGRVVVSVNWDFLEDYERDGSNKQVYITPKGTMLFPRRKSNSRLPSDYYEVISAGIAACQ